MKTMYLLILMISISIGSIAQNKGWMSKEQRLDLLAKIYSIDKKKAAAILSALDYNREKIAVAARDTSLKEPAKTELLRKLYAERQSKIQSVLSPTQLAVYQANIDSLRRDQKSKIQRQRLAHEQQLKDGGLQIRSRNEDHKEDKKP